MVLFFYLGKDVSLLIKKNAITVGDSKPKGINIRFLNTNLIR